MPMLRPHPFTLRPMAATVARSCPASAAAPQIFSTRTVTPTPRRPAVYRLSSTATSSLVTMDSTFDARVLGGHLGRHLEVHDVAGVVLHDVQHAGAPVDELGRLEHLVGRRRGEDLARAGGVEHAETDEAAVQRLVPGPAAGDQPDLAGDRGGRPVDDLVVVVDPQARVGGGDAEQRLVDDVCRVVDQLLHDVPPWSDRGGSGGRLGHE